jgi:hypothetical protein
MAIRLEDEDERVSSLSHLFFQELSRKGNAIYNMLPDVISQLACGEAKLEAAQFKKITSCVPSLSAQSLVFIMRMCKCVFQARVPFAVR